MYMYSICISKDNQTNHFYVITICTLLLKCIIFITIENHLTKYIGYTYIKYIRVEKLT